MEIFKRICELLKTRHLTQADLTRHLGLEKSTFSSWKTRKSSSYKKYLPEIADFLSVTLNELVYGTDDIPSIFNEYGDVLNKIQRENISPEELEIAVDFIITIKQNTTHLRMDKTS